MKNTRIIIHNSSTKCECSLMVWITNGIGNWELGC